MNKAAAIITRTVVALAVGGALIAGAGLMYGRDNVWRLVAGPADLGAVDFTSFVKPGKPNGYLLCPPGVCKRQPLDSVAPAFDVPVDELRKAAEQVLAGQDRLTRVAGRPGDNQQRFVQRTRYLRFPDTISVRFVPLSDKRSSLAIYSRSQIGYSDRGKNEARVQGWLKAIRAALKRGT